MIEKREQGSFEFKIEVSESSQGTFSGEITQVVWL